MLKFSFLRQTATPVDQLKVGDRLHSKIDKRRITITEAVTINDILHYRVNVEHGTTQSHKLMSSQAIQQYRYRLTKTPDRPKQNAPDNMSVAGDGIQTSRSVQDLP